MVVCFVVVVLIVQTFKEYTPFAAVAEALREKPPDYFNRANIYLAQKEYDKAIADYTEAIRLDPNDARPYERLAWVLATTPRNELRKGKKAVEYATKACELTEWKNPDYLATLSAAYAELGDFKEAIKWQAEVCEYPELEKNKGEEFRHRLKMFQEGKPYREKS
jgi:tetratricopeptide (TPR) repeat protein